MIDKLIRELKNIWSVPRLAVFCSLIIIVISIAISPQTNVDWILSFLFGIFLLFFSLGFAHDEVLIINEETIKNNKGETINRKFSNETKLRSSFGEYSDLSKIFFLLGMLFLSLFLMRLLQLFFSNV